MPDPRLTGPLPRRRVRLKGAGHVLTCSGPERGALTSWEQLGCLTGAELVIRHELRGGWLLEWLGPAGSLEQPHADATIDLGGRLLLPGLVDCHTHAVFAGDRSAEFVQRLNGKSYAEIAEGGGGILHTVGKTRAASVPELVEAAAPRLLQMAEWGVRVVECKTGYGLDLASEVKILQAIAALRERFSGTLRLVSTAMPAHAVPPEFKANPDRYVALVCEQILPAMRAADPELAFVDVFVEKGYFGVQQAERIAETAEELGLPVKAHVDEFADLGGVAWAVERGAASVEHLLQTSDKSVQMLANSGTVAVGLPLTSVFLREPYAPLRQLVDAGALVAVATDCNPGSAMTTNLVLAMQMAVLGAKLSPQEALRGATRCAALALREPGGYRGRLAVGEPFVATVLDLDGVDRLFYELGQGPRASRVLVDAGVT
ncbi:MAG: imidazolonepropionase [Deltaproteobacteria bacterium]|nr:imidazolonepropionase [Deltaproteobacteria bacterium]